jgi:hypothetical protein
MDLKSLIELYTLHIQEYLKHVCNQLSETQISDQYEHIYNGWLILIHVLSITYITTHDLKQCHHKLAHARLLYLEFIYQICAYKEYLSNPATFVCSKILNDLPRLQNRPDSPISESIPFQSMKHYADFVLGWKNRHIQMTQRLYLANVFLQPYLYHFCSLPTNLAPLLEHIYDKYTVNSDKKHYTLLNEVFLQITSRSNKKKWQNISHFDLFFSPNPDAPIQSYVEQMIHHCVVSA